MKQPFGIIQSKALKMHHAVEDTNESLFDGTRLTRIESAKEDPMREDQLMLTKFADHVRQQQMEDSASRLDRTIRYRESLSDSDAHGSDDHIPPPPPPVARVRLDCTD